MKKTFIFLSILMIFSACSREHENKEKMHEEKIIESPTRDFNVALKFINDYTEFCNKQMNKEDVDTNWVYHNELLTESFKSRYKALNDSAFKEEPEVGLDADPIFDAQDYPGKGFQIIESDKSTGFVTLQGKDWKEFTVVLRIISQNGKWLVDGAGIINIPTDKRAER